MSYQIEVTRQYLKDLKLARKLNDIIQKLSNGEVLPPKNRDHSLINDYKGCWECHITPDWLLIYRREDVLQIISLVRTGSHSDLF